MRPSALAATRAIVRLKRLSPMAPEASCRFIAPAIPMPGSFSSPKSARRSFMSTPSSIKDSSSSEHCSTRARISATVMAFSPS